MNCVKNNFIIVLILLFCNNVFAQNKRKVDSLYIRLAKANTDTVRVILLTDLSNAFQNSYPDSSFRLAKEAYELASESNYKFGKGRALFCMAVVQQLKGKYEEALNYLNQSLSVFESSNRQKEIASVYNTFGLIHYGKHLYPEALNYFYKSIKIYHDENDLIGEATANGNVAMVYYNNGNYDKCSEYWLSSIELDEKAGNPAGVARHNGNLGNVYFKLGGQLRRQGKEKEAKAMYTKSINAYNLAYQMLEKQNNKSGMALQIGNMANLFYDLGDTAKTIEYYNKAYAIYEKMHDKRGMSTQLGNSGWIYYEKKQYKKAEEFTLRAIEMIKDAPALDLMYNWYDNLNGIYESAGDFESALSAYKKFIMLRDSTFNIDIAKRTLEAQMNFEFDKKEALAKEEKEKQTIIRNAFIAGFALMFIMAVIILRGYRNKQKANQLVSKQKELLQEKNKEITDSILYAKRIQNAHLPSNEYISKKMTELKKKV